jgi:23S rRNA (cytidine2498-2'-O)-methyltransferase
MPDFVFATCRAGSEAALKREVAVRHGEMLTPAFMRPQLITWKARAPLDERFELGAVFAAVSGRSLGTARTVEEVAALSPPVAAVQVLPRVMPEDGLSVEGWASLDAIRDRLTPLVTKAEEKVLDVIVGEGGEPWFVGWHRGDQEVLFRGTLPPEAPSRAWLKMEQALAWAGLAGPKSLVGRRVIELGCAPGGGSYSLLQHGAEVIGVDTGAMSQLVLDSPLFTQVKMAAGDFQKTILPHDIDILTSDMNLEPNLVLDYVEFITGQLEPRLLILTLKLNDAKVEARLPALLQRVQRFAPKPVRAKQLPANRRDLCVIAGRLA